MCAAAATEVAAQDRSLVLNEQLQLGEVFAGQTLNVVDVSAQVTATTNARGNQLIGGSYGRSTDIVSSQEARDVSATTTLSLGGDTAGLVTSATEARGNLLSGAIYNGPMTVDATQTASGDVTASTAITGTEARLVGGGQISAGAFANTAVLGGSGTNGGRAVLTGRVDQTTTGDVRATNLASPRFVRDPAEFSSQAVANVVQATTTPNANQELQVRQRSSGALVEARTGVWAGNGWNLAARAHAGGNQASFHNQGGSLVPTTDQANSARVRSDSELSAYDFGKATSSADAVANEVSVANNDIYVDIDNTQMNTGGVEATASFTGQTGYDAYVGANAAGNAITGYGGAPTVRNVQTNSGDVSAIATTTINGSGRHVITGANAVGNAATFYVNGTGGN